MKKSVMVIFITLFSLINLFAYSLSVGTDLGSIQDAFQDWSQGSGQVGINCRSSITDTFEIRFPINVIFNERSAMFDFGLHLVYYPWERGPFVTMSLVQLGLIAGNSGLERNSFGLNEIMMGWTFTITDKLLIEPSVSIRDPAGVYKDEYLALKGEFPCYRTVRINLAVCWQVWSKEK